MSTMPALDRLHCFAISSDTPLERLQVQLELFPADLAPLG